MRKFLFALLLMAALIYGCHEETDEIQPVNTEYKTHPNYPPEPSPPTPGDPD